MPPKDRPDSNPSPGRFGLFRESLIVALVLISVIILATFGQRLKPASTASVASNQAAIRFAKLPMDFEVNRGQADPAAKYIARGAGYSLFVTEDGAALSMARHPGRAKQIAQNPRAMAAPIERHALQMNLVGANPHAAVAGVDQTAAISNYLIGNDRRKWHTRIPHYNRVRQNSVYPGIDLVYYGADRKLEYDFIVKPNADPSRIRMRFSGADKLALDANSDIAMQLGAGKVALSKPIIYQEIAGKRVMVEGSYRLEGNTVAVEVASYDRSRPLVIDPVLGYATFLGGSGDDGASAIAVDSNLNAYLTGITCSQDFPHTFEPFNQGCNAFITKINSSGSSPLVYSTFLSSETFSIGTGIAVDGQGFAYVTGAAGPGLFTTDGAIKGSLSEEVSNAFVVKLTQAGDNFVYSTYLGGSINAGPYPVQDTGLSIALLPGCQSNCNAYVGGSTDASNFPVAPVGGSIIQSSNGGQQDAFDGFVSELTPDATGLVFSTYLGGNGGDVVLGIALATDGTIFVTGGTDASQGQNNFPVKGSLQQFGGTADAFVASIASNGGSIKMATYLGGTGYDTGLGIAVDTAGNAYVSGITFSADFPTSNGAQNAFGHAKYAKENGFVAKLDKSGTMFDYVTYLGGISAGVLGGPVVDASGNAYVTGFTDTPDFPVANQLFGPSIPFGVFLRSTDGANTFTGTALPSSITSVALLASTNPETIYATTVDAGLLESTDSGATFTPTGISSGFTNGVIALAQDQSVLVGTLNGVMRSTDGGGTFATVLGPNPAFPIGLDLEFNEVFAATGDNGIAVSTDRGITYAAATVPPNTEAYSLTTDGIGNVYAGTSRGIIISTDNGFTFTQTPVNFDAIFNVFAADNGLVLAAGQNNEVIESTDGFNTYFFPRGPNSGPGYGFQIDFDDSDIPTIYAATAAGLLASSDNGQSFSNVFALPVFGINSSPFVGPFEFNALSLDFTQFNPAAIILGLYEEKDAVIAQLNPAGNQLPFSTYLGGISADFGQGIALAPDNSALFVDGTTASANFPATNGAEQTKIAGLANAFAAKILLSTATASATASATATSTATATATATATSTASATATSTATPTATATVTPTATATATAVATTTATATSVPTVIASATVMPTMSATPTPQANIVVTTQDNLIGKAGQTLDAGSFTFTNTEPETTEQLSSVTITVSDRTIIASLTLCVTFEESSQWITVSPVMDTNVFTLEEPIIVPAGGPPVNFALTAVIAGNAAPAAKNRSMVLSFNPNRTGGGGGGYGGGGLHIQSPLASLPQAISGPGAMMLAGALLAMLALTVLFPIGLRPRVIAASIGLMMTTVTMSVAMTGCDPCPACTTAKLTSSVQVITDAGVTDLEDFPIPVSGVPVVLSQVSK